jgi:membrane-associated phospholipid phosphatase
MTEKDPAAQSSPAAAGRASPWVRAALVALGLGAWFLTQRLIGARPFPAGGIGDGLFKLTEPLHAILLRNPAWADGLLLGSSAVIDLLGIFLLASAVFGPSVRPFLGLLILFGLRQLCQGLCALPPPEGMIWRDPGFPTLLVTYGVSNDLFFSGHTAIAVFGATELSRIGRRLGWIAGATALLEAAAVIVLRAHYTMDVFTGAVTAFLAAGVAERLAPACDRALARLRVGASQGSGGL